MDNDMDFNSDSELEIPIPEIDSSEMDMEFEPTGGDIGPVMDNPIEPMGYDDLSEINYIDGNGDMGSLQYIDDLMNDTEPLEDIPVNYTDPVMENVAPCDYFDNEYIEPDMIEVPGEVTPLDEPTLDELMSNDKNPLDNTTPIEPINTDMNFIDGSTVIEPVYEDLIPEAEIYDGSTISEPLSDDINNLVEPINADNTHDEATIVEPISADIDNPIDPALINPIATDINPSNEIIEPIDNSIQGEAPPPEEPTLDDLMSMDTNPFDNNTPIEPINTDMNIVDSSTVIEPINEDLIPEAEIYDGSTIIEPISEDINNLVEPINTDDNTLDEATTVEPMSADIDNPIDPALVNPIATDMNPSNEIIEPIDNGIQGEATPPEEPMLDELMGTDKNPLDGSIIVEPISTDANALDGSTLVEPISMNVDTFYTQGNNDYGFEGTCGPTSIANSLNKLLGSEYKENDILKIAVDNNLCSIDNLPENSGGTTTSQFTDIIKKLDIPGVEAKSYDYVNALEANEIADKLDQGCAINISVDSARLWDELGDTTNNGLFGEDVYSDHWITVSGVDRQDGKITGFDIIDSGGGEKYVDIDKFNEMYYGTADRRIIDPTCIVISKKDVPQNNVSAKKPFNLFSFFRKRGPQNE